MADIEETEPVTDTWYDVALPILRYVNDLDPNAKVTTAARISAKTGIDSTLISRDLQSLAGEYIGGNVGTYRAEGLYIADAYLTSRGAHQVGRWPSDDPFEALVALLEKQIAETTDPDKASAFKKFLAALKEVSVAGGGTALGALLMKFVQSGF